jgi:hypothetical protein
MSSPDSIQRVVQKALAFAHAALDETTPHRVAAARRYAAEVLPCIERLRPSAFTMSDGGELIALVGQLRALLQVLERKNDQAMRGAVN